MKIIFALPYLLAVMTYASAARAEEDAPVARGTKGLVAMSFRADNAGSADIACRVALAHWYSADLGTAAPGASVGATLWFDPKDGNVFLLNGLEDHMPVQTLWCAEPGRAWSARAVIRLERRAGAEPAPIHIVCGAHAERLVCR